MAPVISTTIISIVALTGWVSLTCFPLPTRILVFQCKFEWSCECSCTPLLCCFCCFHVQTACRAQPAGGGPSQAGTWAGTDPPEGSTRPEQTSLLGQNKQHKDLNHPSNKQCNKQGNYFHPGNLVYAALYSAPPGLRNIRAEDMLNRASALERYANLM